MTVDVALNNYETWLKEIDKSSASWYWKKHAFREDRDSLIKRLVSFRSTEDKPLSDTLDDYRSKMSMQEMYDCLCLQVSESFIENLLENEIGNPPSEIVLTRKGQQLRATFNDLILISFVDQIFNALSTRQKTDRIKILEIGGGYGGLAAKLKKLLPSAQIYIVDIPHAGLLQAFYLSKSHPTALVDVIESSHETDNLTKKFDDLDFLIVPDTKIEVIKEQTFDLAINTRSFMEMDQKTIRGYFDFIQSRLSAGALFFNCNRLWKNAGDRPTQISRYPYDDRWDLISLGTSFFQNNAVEILARRREKSNLLFLALIRGLPRTDFLIHGKKFQGLIEFIRPYLPAVLTMTYWKRIRKYR